MSAVAHPSALGGPRNGGVAARRAVTRWARRMFRREWRQQLLVVTLLTVAVAAAIGSITLVYNTSSAVNSEFGSANTVLEFDGTDPQKLAAGLAAAKKWFGTTDVIGHRSVAVPGSVDKVDFRAQDPDGAYGSDLLALRQGRYPEGRHEVAVTDGVAKLLRLELGSTVALDGVRRTVVGIVENPRKLSDEFALVSPAFAGAPNSVMVLVDANDASLESFQDSLGESRSGFAGMMRVGNDGPPDTLAMFSVATVFLLLASLIAAAGFAVIAQRRLRHLGMLAAIGATQKHLRLVLITNGAIVGAIAALCGTLVGLALWVVFAPTLESAVDHRVDRLSLPWLLIALTVLLALFGAIAAAWWPGRTVARLPVTLALSGRPPKPRPARHSAIAAAALIAVGIGCLALSNRDRPPLIVAGIVATIIGCLLIGPLAIRVFSGLAGRVSIAPRLALRDLARYQARSGAALAAVTLALGIAATVVIIASAEAAKKAAEPANLSDRQMRVYLGPPEVRELTPVDTPAQLDRLAARVRRIAAQLDAATVIPLRKPTQPGVAPFVLLGTRVFAPLDLMSPSNSREEGKSSRSALYVATPAVLRYLGIDPATIAAGTDFLVDRSVKTDDLIIPDMSEPEEDPRHERPEDRPREPPVRLGQRANAADVHHPQRSTPSRLEPDPRRLARRLEPAADERPDRRRSQYRGERRPHSRGPAWQAVLCEDDGHRDRRRRPPGARHPRDDGRTDPQRERRRPPHPDRDRSHLGNPPQADRHHRRGTRLPGHAPRRRRRLRRPYGDVLRRPRLPERRTRPVPRPRSHRRPARRHRSRLAPRRPRAARNRQDRNPMTGLSGERWAEAASPVRGSAGAAGSVWCTAFPPRSRRARCAARSRRDRVPLRTAAEREVHGGAGWQRNAI